MSIPRIAEELGRSETTIRNHLTRKTKAGQLVWQTYERFVKEGVKLDIEKLIGLTSAEASKLREEKRGTKEEVGRSPE